MSFHNPFSGYRISQGWTEGSHAANPAVDYPTPIGFAFTAPADGVWHRMPSVLDRSNKSAAGHYGYLELDNGDRIYFCHLRRHIAADGARVTRGVTVLAETGNTGYVRPAPTEQRPYLGAHVHTYGRRGNGARFDWTKDVGPAPKPAGSAKPAALSARQRRVVRKVNRRIGSPSTTAKTGTPLQPGTVGNFVGFIRGESVGGSNIWLKGISGDYFHAANFEGSHKGLPDLGTWKTQSKPASSKPKPKPAAKPKTLHLPSFYWYDHPTDAEKHQDVHGKRRGESMLSGQYTVLETSKGGAFKVRSGANGVVWVSPLAKKYLR